VGWLRAKVTKVFWFFFSKKNTFFLCEAPDMYSDTELEAAVKAGVLTAPAVTSFRDFVARARLTPGADEEHFRLLTGFNDIFVSIAAVLILVAVGWLGARLVPAAGAFGVAGVSWGLAEYFTRRRRMALPSILLLVSFVGGVFFGLLYLGPLNGNPRFPSPQGGALIVGLCAAGAAGAAYAHWRRFMVPITVAVGAVGVVGTLIMLLAAAVPAIRDDFNPLVFAGGLAVFGVAMWWDMSDRSRTTRRSDVAFWLHLAAAPLIVHPAFGALGLLGRGTPSVGNALVAVGLYLVLALVAIAVDRRALLVSALLYVLWAITALLRGAGAVSISLALAALVIGCGLLLLSALWQRARGVALSVLPMTLRTALPAA
jgi:hypothetical protein